MGKGEQFPMEVQWCMAVPASWTHLDDPVLTAVRRRFEVGVVPNLALFRVWRFQSFQFGIGEILAHQVHPHQNGCFVID